MTAATAVALTAAGLAGQSATYANLEPTAVHPVRVSADGLRLYALNPNDDRLSVFDLRDPAAPRLLREIRVGLRPVSVTERSASELWVCNQLSDSVSIVDPEQGVVTGTLRVDDEPSDVAFAAGKAFVTAATRDEVHVFDAASRSALGVIDVFGREPRAIVTAPDGLTVWVLARRSGNGTTLLETALAPPQPLPTNPALPPAPQTGRIIRADDPAWSAQLDFTLPDLDAFAIDAGSQTVVRSVAAVGTTNFDLAFDPSTGDLLVANSDARNLVRFVPNLRGHVVDHRITRVGLAGPNPTVTPVDLNPGIDYSILPNPQALATALADPTGLCVDANRGLLWVAAQGSDRVGVLDLGTLQVVDRIDVRQGGGTAAMRGPRNLALHPTDNWLYVHYRLSGSIGVIDANGRSVVGEVPVGSHDPEPAGVAAGRRFLHDARLSGNGTISCASCHVDGEDDGLAWDLGDPGGQMTAIPVAFQQGAIAGGPAPANFPPIHPMKGPLVTQTLRGMTGRPHWRGDLDSFLDFNATFADLMGGSQIPATDMATFQTWADSVLYPPNPNQNLDRSLTAVQQQGLQRFTSGFVSCVSCHVQPTGTNGMVRDQPIGTNQPMKIAQLRNYYRKSSMSKHAGGGPIKAGFGLFKDGEAGVIADIGNGGGSGNPAVEHFLRAWDTATAPAVGLQVHVDAATATSPATMQDLGLLESRANLNELDVVVHGRIDGMPVGFLFDPAANLYRPDTAAANPSSQASLVQLATQGRASLVWTATMPGAGARAIDRDLDGVLDGDARGAFYGAASASCGQPPEFAANVEPRTGAAEFTLYQRGLHPGNPALVAIALASGSTTVLGAEILVALNPAPMALSGLTDARGSVGFGLPMPTDPTWAGLPFFAQALQFEPCSGGFTASPGRRFVILP